MIFKALKGKLRPKIMIMGSTPELRRILYTQEYLQNAEVFCVDVNENMYQAMSNFIENGDHFNEKFINRSWLDTKIKNESIDLIVGDEVICNVPSNIHENLFQEVNRILKKGGVWITRHNVFTKDDSKSSVKWILGDIAAKISTGTVDFQYALNLLYVKLFYYSGRAEHLNNSMVGHVKLSENEYEKYFKNHNSGKIIRELIDLYKKNFLALSGSYRWYVLSDKKSEAELQKYFTIKDKKYSTDYPTAENSPIYLLNKKDDIKTKKANAYNPSWSNYYNMWGKTESPWRPNGNDIALCEKMLKMVLKTEKVPRALVLGVTPEIRDLLAKYKIETTLVDINPVMKKAMDKLMMLKNPKEKLIVSSWLDFKLPANYFDLVFSDGPLCNIALNTWDKFIGNVNESLKKDGLFYLAAWVYQIKNPWGFNDLIAKYKKDPNYFRDFKNRIWSLHRLFKEPGLYNIKKRELYYHKVVEGLEKFVDNGVINKSDLKKIQWVEDDLGNYVEIAFDDVKKNDDILKKYYKIVEVFTDKTHPLMAFRRDYILKKK
jgi:SAM-dependent methyltransferase